MSNFLDICEKAIYGPIMSEKDFDMKVFMPKIKELVRKYGIQYDRENPVPCDDRAADNLFHAAVEFLSAVGIYCQDTNRLIQFTKEEILEGIAEAPGRCHLGEGKDAKVFGIINNRHFFGIVFAWICVVVEIILNSIGALIWNYWWWDATFPWLIFVLGYLPFFMIAYVVYDLPKLKHQILVVSIMAALVLVSLLVFIPLRWI